MSFLGRLFGSEKALTTMVKSVSSGLDVLIHTDEEKAQEAMQERSEARKMVIAWMQATQGQNLSRRLIALSITFIWLLQYMASMTLGIISVWVEPLVADKVIKSANVIGDYASSMNGAMMLILGFYFAAPHMGSIAKTALEQFNKRKS